MEREIGTVWHKVAYYKRWKVAYYKKMEEV